MRATRLASTGGYLGTGNATVLLGVPDEAVPAALAVLTRCCAVRREWPAAEPAPELPELYASGLAAVPVGGGIAFVARVTRFARFE